MSLKCKLIWSSSNWWSTRCQTVAICSRRKRKTLKCAYGAWTHFCKLERRPMRSKSSFKTRCAGLRWTRRYKRSEWPNYRRSFLTRTGRSIRLSWKWLRRIRRSNRYRRAHSWATKAILVSNRAWSRSWSKLRWTLRSQRSKLKSFKSSSGTI